MSTADYLESQFPHQVQLSRFATYSRGYKRQSFRAVKIFNRFMERRFPREEITYQHLICYMMYRCLGEREPGLDDVHNGAVSLSTFRASEIANLIELLIFQGRVSFGTAEFIRSKEYQAGVAVIKRYGLGSTGFTHARPLFFQDEMRLRSCLTKDTASLRDESLIILLRSCGARSASVTAVRCDMHVYETSHGALEISVPSCKTEYNRLQTVVLIDSDARILRNWIRVRRTMFPENPFLFVTSKGSVCDTNDITQMLYKLGQCAGYGPRFFSSHSFRTGYANTVAAKIIANGGGLQQAIDELVSQKLWSPKSNAINHYIDPNLFSFFRGGYNYTFEQFVSLTPERLHGLEPLHPPQRRPLTWFHHPTDKLTSLCAKFQVPYHENQFKCRTGIGQVFLESDVSFAQFAQEVVIKSGKGLGQVLSDIVGCLLDDDWIDVAKWMVPSLRQDFLDTLCIKSYPLRTHLTTRVGQRTEVHNLFEREQAIWVEEALNSRRYDRMVHLGQLPDGNLVQLRVREIETEIQQIATLPWFDPEIYFPRQERASPSGHHETSTPIRSTRNATSLRVTPSTGTSTPYISLNSSCD